MEAWNTTMQKAIRIWAVGHGICHDVRRFKTVLCGYCAHHSYYALIQPLIQPLLGVNWAFTDLIHFVC